MYSLPMALEGSSLQSRISGVGTVVLDLTKKHVRYQTLSFAHDDYPSLPYLLVATSELVVSLAGPAEDVGSLATIPRALSQVKMNTLL